MWAFISMIICAIVCVVLFIKGNMKLARIIFSFYLTVLTTIWAFVSEIYLILLFAIPFLVMGIVFIVIDDETNVWGREKTQRDSKPTCKQGSGVIQSKTVIDIDKQLEHREEPKIIEKKENIIEKEPHVEKSTILQERAIAYEDNRQRYNAELQALRKRYLEAKKELQRQYDELSLNLRGEYDRAEEELMRREIKLNKKINEFNANNGKIKKEEIKRLKNEAWNKFFRKAETVLEEKHQLNAFFESIGTSRFERAMSDDVEMTNLKMSAEFLPKTDENAVGNYTTTLKGCTCKDFKNQQMPCKHMLHLAYTIGALQLKSKKFDVVKKQLVEDIKSLTKEKEDLEKSIKKSKEKQKKLSEKSVSQQTP